ncbi:MAG: response regulator [Betaproteobacteria bacterium]
MKLLLVEDSRELRDLANMILRELGHEVVAVPDAEAALAMLAQGPCDALVTDVSLPGMSGIALAKKVIEQWPAIAIVISTGYGEITDELVRRELRDDVRVLTKPYDFDAMERILEQARRS